MGMVSKVVMGVNKSVVWVGKGCRVGIRVFFRIIVKKSIKGVEEKV